MTPQAHKSLVMRLLNEHLSAALNKHSAIVGTIARFHDEHNRYHEALGSLTDDQERLIIEGLQLLLTMAAADVDEANAALELQMKEKA